MREINNFKDYLFGYLELACLCEGGDGDSALITPDYLYVAKEFDMWLIRNKRDDYWIRTILQDRVLYHHDQEAIIITHSRENINPYTPTIIETSFII